MDWEDVKTFATLAQSGTVRSAAATLKVHHATVGRRIARLEQATGSRLFNRRPEGFELTQSGEELLAVASSAATEFETVERRIAGKDTIPSGKVMASMGEPIASLLIAPGMPAFAADYPMIELRIEASWRLQDVARGRADVVIRLDNNPQDTLFGKRLFSYAETIYANPSVLQAWHGDIDRTNIKWIGWGGSGRQRPSWVESTEYATAPVWGGFADITNQVALAQAGLGFIALPCLIGDSVAGLERVPDLTPRPERDIWLLTHNDLRRTRRIRIVMEFFEAQLRQYRSLIQGHCPRDSSRTSSEDVR